jgi:nicotinamide mononucleotide adenylyltransferase
MDGSFDLRPVAVPCAGKLQPEHLLKAFEAGADLVCILPCEEGNCHYLEGSRRANRRIEYVRKMLDEVGLDGRRLLAFPLPGSAREDLALGAGAAPEDPASRREDVSRRLAAVSEEITNAIRTLGPSPLRRIRPIHDSMKREST